MEDPELRAVLGSRRSTRREAAGALPDFPRSTLLTATVFSSCSQRASRGLPEGEVTVNRMLARLEGLDQLLAWAPPRAATPSPQASPRVHAHACVVLR